MKESYDAKDTTYKIRFSQSDREKLDFCVNKTGKKRSEVIREGIDKVYNELKK